MFGDALNRTGGTMTGSLTVNNVLPEADNTRDLGSAALSFNDAWFDGTVTIATATITSASVTSFSAALLPNADNTLDLGSAAASWNDLWVDGTATIGTISLTTLTCTGCVGATQLASTTVTAASYGSASGVATFTVDADGRLTTAATTAIAIATSQVTSGNYVATVTAGSGIAVGTGTGTGSTPAFSLTALTADWSQTGAYDIVLGHADSDLKILESTGGTFYGFFNVGDLGADAIYTFSGTTGTVYTTANDPFDTAVEIQAVAVGGDASGTISNIAVANDSHTHDAANLTGTTLAAGVVSTSITSTGTVASGTWSASFGNAAVSSVAGGTYAGDDSIATVGTITAGTWNASFTDASLSAIDGGTWTGATSITTLGTITTGVWNAEAVTSSGDYTSTKADPAIIFNVTTATDTDFWVGVTDDAGSDDDDLFQIGDGTTPGTNPFLTLLTNGNFGISDTSPDCLLDIGASNPATCIGAGTMYFADSDGDQATISINAADNAVVFSTMIKSTVSVALTGTTNNLGTITSGVWNAGAVTSSGDITYGGNSATYGALVAAGTNGVGIAATNASGAIRFYSGGTTLRTTLAATGQLTHTTDLTGDWAAKFINTNANSYGVYAQSTGTGYIIGAHDGTNYKFEVRSTDGKTYTNDGTVTSLSDLRYKTFVRPFVAGLDEVLQLHPALYQHHQDVDDTPISATPFVSLGAQDVRRLIPEAVSGNEATGKLGLSPGVLIFALINSTQELNAKLTTLEAQVAALTDKDK